MERGSAVHLDAIVLDQCSFLALSSVSLKLTVPRVGVKLLNGKKRDSSCHTQCTWVWSHLAVKPVLFLINICYSNMEITGHLYLGKLSEDADVIRLRNRNKSGKVYLYIPPTHY